MIPVSLASIESDAKTMLLHTLDLFDSLSTKQNIYKVCRENQTGFPPPLGSVLLTTLALDLHFLFINRRRRIFFFSRMRQFFSLFFCALFTRKSINNGKSFTRRGLSRDLYAFMGLVSLFRLLPGDVFVATV